MSQMLPVRKEIAAIKPYKPGKPVEEVKRSLGLRKVYKLASNEIPLAPRYIKKAVLAELGSINRYPEAGCFYLRRALSKKLRITAEQIVFGNGSDELITLTLRAFVDRGDEVIIAYPTFLMYEIQAQVQGARIVRVPLKDFRYSLSDIAQAVTPKTKVIFIANPDNPTGTYANHRAVSTFLSAIPRRVLVYFDEAYFEFAPADFPRSQEFLNRRGNLIYARTFSKAYGLAGLRVGYGVTTLPIATALNTIREPFNINRFAQAAAVAALANKKFLRTVTALVRREKQYLYTGLAALGIRFVESATNFIFIDFGKDVNALCAYLLKSGIIVRDLTDWGFKNFFRVTAGLHVENKKFIMLLSSYLRRNP